MSKLILAVVGLFLNTLVSLQGHTQAAENFSILSLRDSISELHVSIGTKFPDECWPGSVQLNPDSEDHAAPVPPNDIRSQIVCKNSPPRHGISVVKLLRSGFLIGSIEFNIVLPSAKICSQKTIRAMVGNDNASIKYETKSEGSIRQITGFVEFTPEVTLALTCTKIQESSTFIGQLQTEYSYLDTTGKASRGGVTFLKETKTFRTEPFFTGVGDTEKEMRTDSEANIKKLWPRVKRFRPLAGKLVYDDIAWARDSKRLRKLLAFREKLLSSRPKPIADPLKDAENENKFMNSSPCYWDCQHDLFQQSGPKCLALKDAKPPEYKGSQTDEKAVADFMENLLSTPSFKACEAERSEQNAELHRGCMARCPDWYQESSYAEVNRLLTGLKQFEDESLRQNGSYTTDLFGSINVFNAYSYKIGFVKPFGVRTPGRYIKSDPIRMNSDFFLDQGDYLLPLNSGVRKTSFSTMLKYCPDCTASQKAFKAIAFADRDGGRLFDVWTIDEGGQINHLANGFPPPNRSAGAPESTNSAMSATKASVPLKIDASKILSLDSIQEFPKEIGQITDLRQLMISNSVLYKFPSEIRNLKKLTRLEIAIENGGIPDWINELSELEFLSITIVFSKIGQAPRILDDFPNTFGKLHKLKQLTIGIRSAVEPEPNERILKFPESLIDLTALSKLDIVLDKRLRIASVSDSIYTPPNVVQFSLQGVSISNAIKGLKKVETLRIMNSGVRDLPPAVGDLPSLKELDLRQNRIRIFPYKKGQFRLLEQLLLEGNELTDFPTEMVRETQLKSLVLGGVCLPPKLLKELTTLDKSKAGFSVFMSPDESSFCKI